MELFSGKAPILKTFLSVCYVKNPLERAGIDHKTLKFAS